MRRPAPPEVMGDLGKKSGGAGSATDGSIVISEEEKRAAVRLIASHYVDDRESFETVCDALGLTPEMGV